MISTLVFLAWAAVAGNYVQEAAPPAANSGQSVFSFRFSAEWISAARGLSPRETTLNAGNRFLRLPQFWAQTELRPDARLNMGSRLTLVVRPRLLAQTESSWAESEPTRSHGDVSANWTELYLNWRPVDAVQATYGVQNFQWGPAELMAPSDRLFHEVGIFRDPLYYVRGKHLARVNVSIGKEWSVIALAEVASNGEPPFVAGETFHHQAVGKVEYMRPSGSAYVGGTYGVQETARPYFGEYGLVSITEGLSAYFDGSHTRGSRAWYPVVDATRARFVQRDIDLDAWRTLLVGGLRYTFASGIDLRGEFISDDAGYREGDMTRAALAAAQATSEAEFEPYLSPGLEFLGRQLGLVSIRFPDLPPAAHSTILARYLQSFTDGSGVAFVTTSYEATGRLVLFASATVTHGAESAEFSRWARAGFLGGAVVTW